MSINAIYLDSTLHCSSPGFDKLLEHIENEIRALGTIRRWHNWYSEHLRVIVLNLIHCHQLDKDLWVAYYRMKNRYVNPSRYAASMLKHSPVVTIADALKNDLGYASGLIGYYDKTAGKGRLSKLKASTKLLHAYDKFLGGSALEISRSKVGETILLRDKDKKLVDYADTAQTNLMRNNLESINRLIGQSFIGLHVPEETLQEIEDLLKAQAASAGKAIREAVDFSQIRLVRIFNNSSFEQGGRFYGSWWQTIPRKYRRHIRINDDATCEMDFSGLHINMLYAEEGLPLPVGDVYELPGISSYARPVLKGMMQILLNSDSLSKALKAAYNEFPRKKYPDTFTSSKITHKILLDALMDKHKCLSKYFCSGYGVKLQYIDSQFAEHVMLSLAARGIVALPVHDSFLVQRQYRQDLLDAMNAAVALRFGKHFGIKAEVTAYEEGLQVLIKELEPEDLPSSVEKFERMFVAEPHTKYLQQKAAWLKS